MMVWEMEGRREQVCKAEGPLCVEVCEEGSRGDACQPGRAGVGQDVGLVI